MKNTQKLFVVTIVLTVGVVIGSIAGPKSVQADDGPNRVQIVSPLPLPVTGTVSLGNLPLPLPITGTVNIVNAQEPWRLKGSCSVNFACGMANYTVPPGKRLVIEYVSSVISGQTGGAFGVISIQRLTPGPFFQTLNSYPIPPNGLPLNGTTVSGQVVRLYFNAGDLVNPVGEVGGALATLTFTFEATGQLGPIS